MNLNCGPDSVLPWTSLAHTFLSGKWSGYTESTKYPPVQKVQESEISSSLAPYIIDAEVETRKVKSKTAKLVSDRAEFKIKVLDILL